MFRAMARLVLPAIALSLLAGGAVASPEDDRQAFISHYQKRFPNVPVEDYSNGPYALDADRRAQWEALQDFPPYDFAVEHGQSLFETPFANGGTYAQCFENGGIGIRQNYPYFDTKKGEVITLELAINRCREANGEKPLGLRRGDMAAISAYMASTSQGKPLNIVIPDDSRAQAAYESGKQFYYTRRGQLNFACSSCHVQNAGNWIRGDLLSASLGHPAAFPVHRLKWGELGTLHRRFAGCNEQVRAEPLEPQSEEYRNLEYFLSYMSNGLPVSGPTTRQ